MLRVALGNVFVKWYAEQFGEPSGNERGEVALLVATLGCRVQTIFLARWYEYPLHPCRPPFCLQVPASSPLSEKSKRRASFQGECFGSYQTRPLQVHREIFLIPLRVEWILGGDTETQIIIFVTVYDEFERKHNVKQHSVMLINLFKFIIPGYNISR